MALNSMQDLSTYKLKAIYDAENQALQAYPQIVQAASSPQLKQALQQHMQQTERQVQRLEQIFQQMGERPSGQPCVAMQGLIQEAQETLQQVGTPELRDAAIIGAAQAMEHHEIAAYGTARTMAMQLGMTQAAQLLEQTLEEEKQTDEKLTMLAEQSVNMKAQQASR